MHQLVLNLHGVGTPHPFVDADERPYWWTLPSLLQLLDQVADRPPTPDLHVALTFDDGNDSDALLVLPELSKRGLTAGFFVCAGRVGKPHYLDAAMITDMRDAGMTVGSHGMHHVDWHRLPEAELEVEIADARRVLEDVVQRPITTVSVPFGSYDRLVLERLRQAQFDCIYTSDRGFAESGAWLQPRETLDEAMQGQDVLTELTQPVPAWTQAKRSLARFYKRMR